MKLLKLTNTPECLKLAECLIGNPLLSRRGKEVLTHGRCGLDFMDSWGHFSRELSIYETKDFKLEDLKVCLYMAMKHEVSLFFKGEHDTGIVVGIGGSEKPRVQFSSGMCYGSSVFDFTLDLTNLPKGASIEEVGE